MPTLSDDQQSLLLRALQSNDRHLPIEQLRNNGQSPSINRMFRTSSNGQSTDRSVNPNALNNSSSPNSFGDFRGPTFGDSFLPDFTNGQQSDFDVDLPQDVSQTLSGFAHGDFGEKRKSPEDDDEDGVEAKRFEGDERISKKPGRKPVAAEPTTVSASTLENPTSSNIEPEAESAKSCCAACVPRAKGKTPTGSREQDQ